MRLESHILTAAPATGLDEQALTCYRLSVEAEERGDFPAAFAALAPFCERVGEEPRLEGLNNYSRARILLRAGVLTSRIGTHKGLKKSQEAAKNLLSLSRSYFEKISFRDGIAEAQLYLAVCYFMLGEMAEARIVLNDALAYASEAGNEVSIKAHIWLAIIEYGSRRYGDALHILRKLQPSLTGVTSHYLLGTFHSEYGKALEAVGGAENNSTYIDQALIELAAASYHFEQAAHERYWARVVNNHGLLLLGLARSEEALEQFDKARRIFVGLGDVSIVARIDVNRARAYLQMDRYFDALKSIKQAVAILERGDEAARFVEALILEGTILARVGNAAQARGVLMRAVVVASEAGSRESAGLAYLTILEEIGGQSEAESIYHYQEARALLDEVQDASVTRRLLNLSGRILTNMGKKAPSAAIDEAAGSGWEGFSLARAKREHEKGWVIKAMEAAGGNVSEASRLLGFAKPQRLHQLLVEYGLGHLKARRHHHSIIEEAEPPVVRDLCSYIEFELPLGVSERDVCSIHRLDAEFLAASGAEIGDYVLVKAGATRPGDLVGVDVYGSSYFIGTLEYDGDYLMLTPPNEKMPPARVKEGLSNVEGVVVGYLKAADVRGFKRGFPVRSFEL